MNQGKVSEAILRRAVFKQIHNRRDEVIVGASFGEDCAILQLHDENYIASSTHTITYESKEAGTLLVHGVINNLVASGASPVGIEISLLLPTRTRESHIKYLMNTIDSACKEWNVMIIGGNTEITDAVTRPILSATGIGICYENRWIATAEIEVGDEIIMSKWAGLQGSALLAIAGESQLQKRFAPKLIDQVKSYLESISVVPEATIAKEFGISAMHDVSRGGVFQALWELVRESQLGFEVDLRKIKVKQEMIEVCEFYQINPYALDGTGALLMTTQNGTGLVERLEEAGIEAAIIGKITTGNDKTILNEDQTRSLDPIKCDEYYKAIEQINQSYDRRDE